MRSILIVNGDPATADLMSSLLTTAGYTTSIAATFEDGKALMAVVRPQLLIADVELGAFNGLHLIIRGRIDVPRLAAILTSGAEDPSAAAEAAKHGAAYLPGPEQGAALLALVQIALAEDVV